MDVCCDAADVQLVVPIPARLHRFLEDFASDRGIGIPEALARILEDEFVRSDTAELDESSENHQETE